MNILAQRESLAFVLFFIPLRSLVGWMILFQIDEQGSDLLSPLILLLFSSGNTLRDVPSLYKYCLNKPSERVEWSFPGLT